MAVGVGPQRSVALELGGDQQGGVINCQQIKQALMCVWMQTGWAIVAQPN